MPWGDRGFWVTQVLVVIAVGIHFVDDLYGSDLVRMPAVATLVLAVVPVGYAATRFGLWGSLPTAVWTAALMLPDFLLLDTGLERWTDGTVLTLVIMVGVAAGRMVDMQRSSTASLAAAERARGMARVADQLPEGVCLTDLDGVITYANPAWASLQGVGSPQAAVGRTLASLHVDEHLEPGSAPFEQPLGTGGQVRALVEHHRAGGDQYWVDVTATAMLDEQGRPIGRLSTLRDVTAELVAAAELKEAEERFRVTFEQAPLGMAMVTLEGRFLQVNDALCQMLGRSAAEVLALGVFGLTQPEDRETTRQILKQRDARVRFAKRYLHGDGHVISVQITASMVRDQDGRPLYYVSQFQDVTEEQRSEQQLMQQALHDSLTGLPNRVLFEDRASQALARAHRQHGLLAVMFCDLDGFKPVNDRYGHRAGDEVLRSVAAQLQECVREVDTVARFGGDEFVVLLDGLRDLSEAEVVATRIHETLGQIHSPGDGEVIIDASIGIAISSRETASLEALIDEADAAMYQAKAAGGHCSRVSSGGSSLH